MKKTLYIVVIVILAVGIFWVGQWMVATYLSRSTTTPYALLFKENISFADGERLMFSDQNYDAAIAAYQAALAGTTDPAQQAQIKYKLAYATNLAGKQTDAIQLFKEIAADTAYPASTRAYAVQYMAGMLTAGNNTAAVRNAIYTGAPYAAMVVEGNTQLTDRYLSEYAVSLSPLALAELNIANWYADDLLGLHSTTTAQAKNDIAIINQRLAAANTDIIRTQNDQSLRLTVVNDFRAKATVLGKLAQAGVVPTAQADAAYQTAFAIAKAHDANDGMIRYQYALYLATFGSTRSTELRSVLAAFSANSTFYSAAATFFKNERTNATGERANLRMLASLDPDFKAYLVSLGWTAADFG